MSIQSAIDARLDRTVLRRVPEAVTPNMVTWSRAALLPLILYLLYAEAYAPALAFFIIAALTDVIDGALARTRNQITEFGKVLDAIADRGLIAVSALMLLPPRFGWWIVLAMGCLELMNSAMAYRSRRLIGYNPGANGAGKIKMALQSLAMIAILIGTIASEHAFGLDALAFALLALGLGAAFAQAWLYPRAVAAVAP